MLPLRLHRQRILADRNAQLDLWAQLHPDRLDGVKQQRVLALVTGRGHPVGGQLDAVQRGNRRGAEVGDRLADGHPRGGGGVQQRQRRAFADRHRLAGHAAESGERDGAIGDRHLPRSDQLIAHGQPADAAVADGDQELFGSDHRMGEHTQCGVVQVQPAPGQRWPHRRRGAPGLAVHLGGLAEQHIHRQIDRVRCRRRSHRYRRVTGAGARAVDALDGRSVTDHQPLVRRCVADYGKGTAFTLADRGELRDPVRWQSQHVALLRFVAPQLHRRQ